MHSKEKSGRICLEVIFLRLLLIEDEKGLCEALEYILKKNKYLVDTANNGETGYDLAATGIYDLIILDRMLPGKDGLTVLRELRASNLVTPVILLTAMDSVENRVEGLDAGADDYLIKPFATEELLARIRALARRRNELLPDDTISLASLTLDPRRCEISLGNMRAKLTLKETMLLELFMRNPGQVITKEQIFDRVWGFYTEVEMNNVEIYIHYLRKKLHSKISGIKIETIRGIGYCLKEEPDVQ